MSLSLEQFSAWVVESRLMSADDLAAFYAALPVDARPETAESLAQRLVEQKRITQFQATSIFQGQHKTLVLGEYVVLDQLGKGGMGIVVKAQHRRMKRVVAMKMLASALLKNQDMVQRFYREVEAAARLTHPNIVTAYDAGESEGLHYLVMEYVDGCDLSGVLKDHGSLPLGEAVNYTLQAARGLAYAHERGVVHRDIKPGNLLLDRHGVVKILDMGLARLNEGTGDADAQQLTQTGQMMGTVDYMSPEQAFDTRRADHRSDIYALGCTLYRLLTNEPPYAGDTIMKKLVAHREHPIPWLRPKRPDAPEALDQVFQHMLAKTADERPQSMAEVIELLERAMAGVSTAPPLSARLAMPPSAGGGREPKGGVVGVRTLAPPKVTEETIPHQTAEHETGSRASPLAAAHRSEGDSVYRAPKESASGVSSAYAAAPAVYPARRKSNRSFFIACGVLVAAIAGGAGAYFLIPPAVSPSDSNLSPVAKNNPEPTPAVVPAEKIELKPNEHVIEKPAAKPKPEPVVVAKVTSPVEEVKPSPPDGPSPAPQPPVETKPIPVAVAPPPKAAPLNVLKLIDLEADTRSTRWTRDDAGDGLTATLAPRRAVAPLFLPVRVTGSYELGLRFTVEKLAPATGCLVLHLPVGEAAVDLVFGAGGGTLVGLDRVGGKAFREPGGSRAPLELTAGEAHTLKVSVQPGASEVTIDVQLDGAAVHSWKGAPGELTSNSQAPPGEVALRSEFAKIQIDTLVVRPLTGEQTAIVYRDFPSGAALPAWAKLGERPTAVTPPVEPGAPWVDVLAKLTDFPQLPKTRRDFRGGELHLAEKSGSGGGPRAEFDFTPTANYELELEFTPKSIQQYFLVLTLPVGNNRVDLTCEGRAVALNNRIERKPYTAPVVFEKGERRVFHIVVNSTETTGSVQVQLDEETIINWHGRLDELAFNATNSGEAGKFSVRSDRDYLVVHGLRCRPAEGKE